MDTTRRTAYLMIVLSLISIPSAIVLSENIPLVFLIVSVLWLISPVLFTKNRPLFGLALAHSLLVLTVYVRSFTTSALTPFDSQRFFTYHVEQGLALLVLFLLARKFYGLGFLRITRMGLARAIIFGILVGFPYGVIDHLSGERLPGMPEMGFTATLLWVVSLSLIVGMSEELLFRGVMYRPARNLVGPRAASLFQAFLFTIFHYPNAISAIAAALLFAVIMVYLTERTGSLYAPVFAHFSNNTMWMMLGRFAPIAL